MSDSEHRIMMNDYTNNINNVLQGECPAGLTIDQFKKNIVTGQSTLSGAAQAAITTFALPLKTYAQQFIAANPSLQASNDSYLYFFASFVPSTRIDNSYYPGSLLESDDAGSLKAIDMWNCAMQSFNLENCANQTVVQDKKNLNKLASYCVNKLTPNAGVVGVEVMLSGFSGCVSAKFIVLEYLSTADLLNNTLIKQKMEILAGTTLDTISNNVTINQFGFTIDTDSFIYINNFGKESYTFFIQNKDGDNVLENLLFTKNKKNDYDVYLVKYSFTADTLKTMTEQAFEQSPKEYSSILIDGKISTTPEISCTESFEYSDQLSGDQTLSGSVREPQYSWTLVSTGYNCSIFYNDDGDLGGGSNDTGMSTSPNDGGHGGGGANNIMIQTANTIEKNIDDSLLNPCSKGVCEKIKNTTNCDFAYILLKLGAKSIYNTTIVSQVPPSGKPAQTIWNSPYNYTIYISTDYPDKTKLFIATLMLHEMVHAYFMSLFDDFHNANPSNPNAYNDFAYLFNYYVTKNHPLSIDAADAQHQQMATDYADAIARALQEYQTGIPVATNSTSDQLYSDLAYGSLQDAPAVFDALFPVGNPNRQRIINRYTCESQGHPIDEGTPNEQNPIGQPCN